jgi:hypothetical protein
MHVNDIRANGDVYRNGNSDPRGGRKNAELLML